MKLFRNVMILNVPDPAFLKLYSAPVSNYNVDDVVTSKL